MIVELHYAIWRLGEPNFPAAIDRLLDQLWDGADWYELRREDLDHEQVDYDCQRTRGPVLLDSQKLLKILAFMGDPRDPEIGLSGPEDPVFILAGHWRAALAPMRREPLISANAPSATVQSLLEPVLFREYDSAKQAAQCRADATGMDHGLHLIEVGKGADWTAWDNSKMPPSLRGLWSVFTLPARQFRSCSELRCEVVSCSDLFRCPPGHGPGVAECLG